MNKDTEKTSIASETRISPATALQDEKSNGVSTSSKASRPYSLRSKIIMTCLIIVILIVACTVLGFVSGWFGTAPSPEDTSIKNELSYSSQDKSTNEQSASRLNDNSNAISGDSSLGEQQDASTLDETSQMGDSATSTDFSSSSGSEADEGSSVSEPAKSSEESSSSTASIESDSTNSSGSSNTAQEVAPEPSTITVSVYVDSSRAQSYGYSSCLVSTSVSLQPGASVYDALIATGISVGGSSSYIRSIGGLAEFACGGSSGWLYFVDGSSPSNSCGSYSLYGGESIRWVYTLDMGNDI